MGQKQNCNICGLQVEGVQKDGKVHYKCGNNHKWTGKIKEFHGKKSGFLGKTVGAALDIAGGFGILTLLGTLFDMNTPITCNHCGKNTTYPTKHIQNNSQQYQCESCRRYQWRKK